MNKIIALILSLFLVAQPLYANDQIMGGITFKAGKPSFFVEYEKEKGRFELPERYVDNNRNIRIDFIAPKINQDIMAYTGYQNVQGYGNNKSKEDKVFAGTIIAIYGLTVIAGALTIAAIINAVD